MNTRNKALLATGLLIFIISMVSILGTGPTESPLPPEYPILEESDYDDTLESHLPIVEIDTGGLVISDQEGYAAIKIYQKDSGMNSLTDTPSVDELTSIRFRGSSSSVFPKKQYRLELYEKDNRDNKIDVPMLGMGADTDWVLHGPYLDKSLIRNALMYDLSRQIMDWAPDSRFCELVLDGSYRGLYLMVETVKVSENRLALTEYSFAEGDTAYLLERNSPATFTAIPNYFLESLGVQDYTLHIEYPRNKVINSRQYDYIYNDFHQFEEVLYGEDYADKTTGYASIIDIDSFVDYYILQEFSMNQDAGLLSTFQYKDIDGKLGLAVWDFNNSFDNYALSPIAIDEFILQHKTWYNRLFTDADFTEKIITRYHELRIGPLSEENLLEDIDSLSKHLGPAINRNDAVWGSFYESNFLGADNEGTTRYIRNHEEAITTLKNTIIERGNYLDENIDLLYMHKEWSGVLPANVQKKITVYQTVIKNEIDWLHTLQLDNGAFAQRSSMDNRATINPYFNTFVARALLRVPRNPKNIQAVEKYIDWHFAHLNLATPDYNGYIGSIYDYSAKTREHAVDSETSKQKYDSLDSYAATFLSLLYDYYQVTSDDEYILGHNWEISTVIDLLLSLQHDGITFTKPDYPIAYLMNNTEVYEGLKHARLLYQEVFLQMLPPDEQDPATLDRLNKLNIAIMNMEQALEDDFWNEQKNRYEVDLNEEHQVVGRFSWQNFYADATGQLFPIMHHLIEPDSQRAKSLYQTFSSYYQWENMQHLTDGKASFYWTRLAYTAALMGDTQRFDTYLENYQAMAMTDHSSPAYNAESAWIILGCQEMIEHYQSVIAP